ncbi:hypothetical protein D9757_010658 [Collybiopsis confluens]|uniref:Uncharacterized protein n=1 Tax=Collybiopsis confluens TaxID=2823264 RepID=A0A8H5GMS7_9AGAR|nr:hypothetical protein D9757_010658 [Collybiopsis confluens]
MLAKSSVLKVYQVCYLSLSSLSIFTEQDTRMITLNIRPEGYEILYNILPQLESLTCVDLTRCYLSSTLLRTLHKHPSISTLLVRSLRGLPKESTSSDLSKVVLVRTEHPRSDDPILDTLQRCLLRGMKVAQLDVWKPDLLDEALGRQNFRGLRELRLNMSYSPMSFSWLPQFTSAHPQLQKIEMIDDEREYFKRHSDPYVNGFMQESSRRKLSHILYINRLVLKRANAQEWRVHGMTLTVWSHLIEVLAVVHTSFPDIKTLDLDLKIHRARYSIDDVIRVLSKLSSLQVLSLRSFFSQLHPEPKQQARPVRKVDRNDPRAYFAARAEPAIFWHASRIARSMPSLEAFHIDEVGYDNESSSRSRQWVLAGWLHVHGGTRDVDGSLQLLTW